MLIQCLLLSNYHINNTLDGQSCVDTVNVMQRGNISLFANAQIVVPRSNFSCNGRLTGYLISLRMISASGSYPILQVWHPRSSGSTQYTRVVTECPMTATDISRMTDDMGNIYYLGNVSCTGNSRIEFQSGDIIGYYQNRSLRYQVWSSNDSIGYTSFIRFEPTPPATFNLDMIDASENNIQPLIQMLYGKAIYAVAIITLNFSE